MDFNDLSDDLKAKARECASPAELLELARNEGVELSDEQLDAVSGGNTWGGCSAFDANSCHDYCPLANCGTFC